MVSRSPVSNSDDVDALSSDSDVRARNGTSMGLMGRGDSSADIMAIGSDDNGGGVAVELSLVADVPDVSDGEARS